MEKCRIHIAKIIKFNEDRFRFDFGLKSFIDNIEEQRKWLSLKEIKEIREKFEAKRELLARNQNKIRKNFTSIKLNRNKNIGMNKIDKIENKFKLNTKTNRDAFKTNEVLINPVNRNIKKKNNSVRESQFPPSFNSKKETNFDILNSKPIKKLLEPIKNND